MQQRQKQKKNSSKTKIHSHMMCTSCPNDCLLICAAFHLWPVWITIFFFHLIIRLYNAMNSGSNGIHCSRPTTIEWGIFFFRWVMARHRRNHKSRYQSTPTNCVINGAKYILPGSHWRNVCARGQVAAIHQCGGIVARWTISGSYPQSQLQLSNVLVYT